MTREIGAIEDVLMVVKTYPTPSATYGELVCTAGVRLRDNKWVRIYPYPFRLVGEDQRFSKYNIVRISLKKTDGRDQRPESYKPSNIDAIKKVGALDTKDHWGKRMEYITPTVIESVAQLKEGMFSKDETGSNLWGPSILPVRVMPGSARLSWEASNNWNDKQLANLKKAEDFVKDNMFMDPGMKASFRQLSKVAYEFRLTYVDGVGDEHTHLILDWEIAQLYRNVRRREKSDADALEKVRQKIEDSIFGAGNDVYLVIGNMHHGFRNKHLLAIDGFIYPKYTVSQRKRHTMGCLRNCMKSS